MILNAIDILLIDDSVYDADLTIRALKKQSIANNLYHVKDGVEALDFIFAQGSYAERDIQIKPKLILLDLKMPKINGIEVLEKIKSDERTKSIPVVVLTSSKEDRDINKCYSLGANSYVVKPVEFNNFQKVVSELSSYWLMLNQGTF